MARYVVTGGCGFIGSHLVDRLVACGHHVTVVDDLSGGSRSNLNGAADLWCEDVAKPGVMDAALAAADGCFHLAAVASVELSTTRWAETSRTNLLGTLRVFEAARTNGVRPPVPVVYASSAAVYGNPRSVPIDETSATVPLSPYGADKLGNELHAAVGWRLHGIPSTGLRFFNVYGPRQDPASPYSGVISVFARRLFSGQPLTVHGDGGQVRDFVFVRDVVDHLVAAMENGRRDARVLNVCTGRPTTINELIKTIGRVSRHVPRRCEAPPRPGDIRVSLGDPRRARAELGVICDTLLDEGLHATLAWMAQRSGSAQTA